MKGFDLYSFQNIYHTVEKKSIHSSSNVEVKLGTPRNILLKMINVLCIKSEP